MTYAASPGIYVGRPPCANCGAAFRLHRADEMCPEAYRPGSLEEAERGLRRAEAGDDEAAVFVARGELQRLRGR